jgi:hypothetical protein
MAKRALAEFALREVFVLEQQAIELTIHIVLIVRQFVKIGFGKNTPLHNPIPNP